MTQLQTDISTPTLTFEEYLYYQGKPDVIYELYRGKLIEMPTPTGLHTRICNFLTAQFQRYFVTHDLPLVAMEVTGVRTEDNTSRIPDVLVCSVELADRICNRKGAGAFNFDEKPVIVVEVTSDNWREDYIRKRAEYALINIPEYWIVDPNKSKIQVCFNPNNDKGYEDLEFLPGQELHSVQFPDFILPVNRVFSPPLVTDLIREEQAERKQLEQRAEEERQRAEEERQRAEEERQRADRLAQRLRDMGIDPDTV
ncbi:Uma2 family endonuclease [Laspinema olomoucense]|uniref:Uma2 family endonuclease n=1 Tax=Laspinema olomoucense TaxID=3231600 RepID=UPI0021BAAE1C|nr:Uma2 family endonuclease [Laspinema sp. D3a]MCT7988671.1 Uma2 family endonuclease [Laspinema sp. D3a]